jgi:hypothetical protein
LIKRLLHRALTQVDSGGGAGAAPRPRAGGVQVQVWQDAVAPPLGGGVVPAAAAAAAPRATGGFGMPSSEAVASSLTGVPTVAAIGVAFRDTIGALFGSAVTESRASPARFWL